MPVCFVLAVCLSGSVWAEPIELLVTGHIDSSTFASIPVGSVLTAQLWYDPATAPFFVSADGSNANYAAPMQEIVDVAGSQFTAPPHPTGWDIFVADNLQGNSGLWGVPPNDDGVVWVETPAESGNIVNDPAFNSNGFDTLQIGFDAPHSSGVLSSTALPVPFPGMTQWAGGYFYLLPVFGGHGGLFTGTIDSVQAVPEPSAAILLMSALALFAAVARKRRPV